MLIKPILDNAIVEALSEVAADLGTPLPEPNGRGGLRLRDVDGALELLGSPTTCEIEWWVFVREWGDRPIRSELLQTVWGEAPSAVQFNEQNFRTIARKAAAAGKRALLDLREDRQALLLALDKAEMELVRDDRIANVRRQAQEAWHRKDYPAVRSLYSSLEAPLSAVEAKRLAIASRTLEP